MTSIHDEHRPVVTNHGAYKWDSFLDRARLALDRAQAAASVQGKRILVTGAGGWIASALTHAISAFAPKQVVLLEAAERNLCEIDAALRLKTPTIAHVSLLGRSRTRNCWRIYSVVTGPRSYTTRPLTSMFLWWS